MRLCRALSIAVCLIPVAATASVAQSAWPAPQQQQAPAGAWPAPSARQQPAPSGAWPAPSETTDPAAPPPAPAFGAAPPPPANQGFTAAPPQSFQTGPGFGAPQAQQQQEPPCFKDFMTLRNDADTKGKAIQAASKKKVPPQVACKLFNDYSASEAKLIKFVSTNGEKCQIPAQVVDGLSKNHAKTNEIRTKVCEVAAAGPPKPRGPSLSDVLNAPVPDSSNVKSGRGTFDTLGGNALAR